MFYFINPKLLIHTEKVYAKLRKFILFASNMLIYEVYKYINMKYINYIN